MGYDLKKDDDLHRAWRYICQTANIEDEQKDIVQKFDKVTREDFLSEEYQRLLWKANPICRSGRAPIDVNAIFDDKDFLDWFYDEYLKIREKKSKGRTELLREFVNELLSTSTQRMSKYSAHVKRNRPLQDTYRALAVLFPENFTRLGPEPEKLAEPMGIESGHSVEVHHRILNRLTKVLGEPNDLYEITQRMILTWDLFVATSKEELGKKSNPPSDEKQGSDNSTTLVEVHVPQLKDILSQVESKGYFPDDLCRKLHFGLWADERRHFAVLTGLSGAGKTLLARAYAEAITEEDPTGQDPKRSCIIAVQPSWTDPSYLLGYANPLQKDIFERTPFLKLILHAIDNPHTPHVAILDEMNLSHPEQYMAPLLSTMETGGSIEIHGHGEIFDDIPNRIPYPNNLVLIGTVNMDESTHGLVDKLLDRAFTLEFWKVNIDEWPGWGDRKKNELPPEEEDQVKEILNALMKALEPARLHFGYRIIEEVVAFLTPRLRNSSDWQFENALDSVIYAKVLPKLRGDYSTRISNALEKCKQVLEDEDKEEKRGFILSNSANKVEELIKDLKDTGSARFWR